MPLGKQTLTLTHCYAWAESYRVTLNIILFLPIFIQHGMWQPWKELDKNTVQELPVSYKYNANCSSSSGVAALLWQTPATGVSLAQRSYRAEKWKREKHRIKEFHMLLVVKGTIIASCGFLLVRHTVEESAAYIPTNGHIATHTGTPLHKWVLGSGVA